MITVKTSNKITSGCKTPVFIKIIAEKGKTPKKVVLNLQFFILSI